MNALYESVSVKYKATKDALASTQELLDVSESRLTEVMKEKEEL